MDAVQQANAGHPGTAMALAPLAYLLYAEVMRHDPAAPDWADRDRFVLSAGHACILQYSALHLSGYDLSARRPEALPPVGLAHARSSRAAPHRRGSRRRPARSGRASRTPSASRSRSASSPTATTGPDTRSSTRWVYAICSDGDLMEGVSHEAASIAGQLGLGKLVFVYDDNHITIDGTTSICFDGRTRGAASRRRAGTSSTWPTRTTSTRCAPRSQPPAQTRRAPSLIVVRSHIAYPAPHAIDTAKAHGVAARRGRGARDEGGARLRPGRRRSSCRPTSESTWRASRSAARPRGPSGRAGSPPGRRRIRTWRPSASETSSADRATAGSTRCPRSTRARRSPRATPARA